MSFQMVRADERHIVFFGNRGADYKAKLASLDDDYAAKRAPLDDDYAAKCAALNADYEAKRAALDAEIIDYIKPLIDGFAWNGKKLVF